MLRHRFILLMRLGDPDDGTFETVCADDKDECLRMIADNEFQVTEYVSIMDGMTSGVLRGDDLTNDVGAFIAWRARERDDEAQYEHGLVHPR